MSPYSWKAEVDRASSAEWSHLLDQFEDANLYQTAAYGEVHWGEKNLSRLVLKRDSEAVALAQLRIIRPTPLKFGIAYLRWGPVWQRRNQPLDPEIAARMAKAIEDEYLKRRNLCVRILPNAFAGSSRAALYESAFCKFSAQTDGAEVYRTFVVDLEPPLEQIRAQLDPKWRNKLRQAEKNDLTVTSSNSVDAFRSFIGIYRQMLKRKGFDTSVDVEEFASMQKSLAESQRMQVFLCESKGVIVAAVVVTAMGDSAIYVHGATSDAGLNARGAYLLQWTAFQWLKSRGVRWYDLGGIDPIGNPGVYSYKKGFSGQDICQIPPLIASESMVSYGLAKAGFTLKHTLRSSIKPFLTGQLNKKAAATS